jgi:hypothetical protein
VGSTNRRDADLHVLVRGAVEHAQRARHRDVPRESHPLRQATPAQAGVCVGPVTRSCWSGEGSKVESRLCRFSEGGQEPTFGTGAKFRVLRHRLCSSADYASISR